MLRVPARPRVSFGDESARTGVDDWRARFANHHVVIEAEDNSRPVGAGTNQALEYDEILDLPYAVTDRLLNAI